VQGIDPTRQVDDRSFQLLDTQWVELEQLEGGLLEGSWLGMEREAVLGVKGHAHRVLDQRAEMSGVRRHAQGRIVITLSQS
jgi:hypothetical protein